MAGFSSVVIYKILRAETDKCYVGSTCNKKERRREHFKDLDNNRHHSPYLQRSYNKYGRKVFKFIVVDVCKESDRNWYEEYWMEKLNSCYNGRKFVDGVHRHSDSTKEKMSIARGHEGRSYGIRSSKN